jgi:ubiquinone/menaquinone biosynthesis C-methylase UbiE
MSQTQLRTLESYVRLMNTNATSQIFRAAVELGVFAELAHGQRTTAELAEQCGVQSEPLGLLLDALCAAGALERYGDDYALAQVMHMMAPALRDLGDRYWQHLTHFVRTGESIPQRADQAADEHDFHDEAAASQWLLTPAALDLAQVLDIGGSRRGLQVLELAAGGAVWSLTIAHRDPTTHITALDQAAQLEAARRHAEAIGVADRLTLIAGDYRDMAIEAGAFDLILVSNLMHRGTLDVNLATLQRCYDGLRPSGELALIDAFPGQAKGDLHHQLFRLSVALRTADGRVHAVHDLSQLLIRAGFDKPRFAHLPSPPHTLGLLLATRGDASARTA